MDVITMNVERISGELITRLKSSNGDPQLVLWKDGNPVRVFKLDEILSIDNGL